MRIVRSIRQTVTLWYVGILALTLGLFSGLLYTTVSRSLARHVNRTLELQAASVADTIQAFWSAERAAPLAGPGNWAGSPSDTLQDVLDAGQLPVLVQRWADKTGSLQTDRAIRLVDRFGRPIAESDAFTRLTLPLEAATLEQARRGDHVYGTIVHAGGLRVQLLTYPVILGGRILYLIQVATSLEHVDTSLARLQLWLIWLTPITLLGTSAIGWFLATQAMEPVGRMTRQAQRISAEHLDERLDVPPTRDELERLAVTFNDLLTRLETAFRRLRQFSAAASHELRTPLTVMKGELEVILRKPRPADEYQRVLRTQLEAVDEMAQLVEELLMLARSDAAKGEVERRPVELGALAREVGDVWRRLADPKRIRVEVAASDPVWVLGERRLLERLVANLLDNAIRHTPANGQIRIMTECRAEQGRLVVADTGPGIPSEELPHLFDRFFKRPASADGSSTGLGLGLCRWIVEAHGGRIDLASVPGRPGATFAVCLPRAPHTA
ncbi:MAG: HAMP domain-containing protein [Candidatus Omnitrophica bacterium]|nr:HAMP domain-containing protein [Candidatus Omnitrophota bacterium]